MVFLFLRWQYFGVFKFYFHHVFHFKPEHNTSNTTNYGTSKPMSVESLGSIDRFHSRGKQLCKFVGTKTFFTLQKCQSPTDVFLYTNMAAVFIVLYTNMAAVTSGENDL